jgi:hypothetical protein
MALEFTSMSTLEPYLQALRDDVRDAVRDRDRDGDHTVTRV